MEGAKAADNGTVKSSIAHDVRILLSTHRRDFLVRNSGEQVKVADLHGRIVGLYFSASCCGFSKWFNPKLIEVYNELSLMGKDFEVIFISTDKDDHSFSEYFSMMPWLAVPFSDSEARNRLSSLFKVTRTPQLVVLDGSGTILSSVAARTVGEYGSEGYPFTSEKIKMIKENEEAAKKMQTLQSVLASASRDYLIRNDGSQVPITELEGKIVGLYISPSGFSAFAEFTRRLVEMYNTLKERGEELENVFVSLDEEESTFNSAFASMPWLAIPFRDKGRRRLARYFEIRSAPALAVLGPDGKTLNANVADFIEEHGVESFPFSTQKLEELKEKERAMQAEQTLESLLVLGELDYIIEKGGVKVPVSELAGKNFLLYFSAHWCGPCRTFLPKLLETYHKIKDTVDATFEVLFISSDRDQNSFDEFFSGMPWLALPFGDERKQSLSRKFKIRGIPSLVAIGPSGRTVGRGARELVIQHGAEAYPFTEERVKEVAAASEEVAKGWPEKVKHGFHEEHELVKGRQGTYKCSKCQVFGHGWSFSCADCYVDLHPECALEGENSEKGEGSKDI